MTDEPRVPMLPIDRWEPGLLEFVQRAVLSDDEPLNFFKAMAHHPKLLEKWTRFAARLLGKGILEPRDRELVVLRTVWNAGAMYEWVHHAAIGQENGLSPEEIESIKTGPADDRWAGKEKSLLLAADELHHDQVIGDSTLSALLEHFSYADLLEIVMLAGNYHLVSYFVNTFGVPLEEDVH